jgi:hypothetical protein
MQTMVEVHYGDRLHEASDIEANSTHCGLASSELLIEYGADISARENREGVHRIYPEIIIPKQRIC